MRENTIQCVEHCKWVDQLIDASRDAQADTAALLYLEYLSGCDQSAPGTQNRISYWAALLQKHRAALPKPVEFFAAHIGIGSAG
ncbi:MAG: hypothetical protein ABSF64_20680 [Bryobacteraceae bacterium]|jgi:hypothetical protein